jgi:quercetin dioxygenase-like cupin family protein
MRVAAGVAVAAGILTVIGCTTPPGRLGGAAVAQAQEARPVEEKGVKTANLVSSTGGFGASVSLPVVLSGQTVEIEPGGQTGKQRYLVPAFVYVLQGVLTTDTESGPTGVAGIQYYAAGQAVVLPPPGTWTNFFNGGQAPVKYLVLFIAPPGARVMQKAAAE